MRGRASLLVAVAAAIGCVGPQVATAGANGCPGEATQASAMAQPLFQRAVFCLINQQRISAGRRPVRANGRLRNAAAGYAGSMVSRGFFSHTSPSGATVISRLRSVGYLRGHGRWEVGENLGWATGPLSSPASIIDNWMHSPEHRENLLKPSFRELGVGAVRGTPFPSATLPTVSVPALPLPIGIAALPADPGVTVATEYGVRRPPPEHAAETAPRN